MSNSTWYTYKPVDTILVRGADDDSSSNNTIFPPPAQTITGAVRTAYLREKNVTFSEYIAQKADKTVYEKIGNPSELPQFAITGPLFEKEGEVFLPVPATWFYQKDTIEDIGNDDSNSTLSVCTKDIVHARKINQNDFINKKIFSSRPIKVWPETLSKSIEPLAEYFINIKDLQYKQKQELTFYASEYFYKKEERVGVALYDDRSSREGKLYSFSHFRLTQDVRLLFGITKDCILSDKGYLRIGAEQRFGLYEEFTTNQIANTNLEKADSYLALSYIPCTQENQKKILAFERIVYFGGWDMAKGFHKPTQAYYPPGSVFAEYIENTISI